MFPQEARGFIEEMMASYFATGQASGHACIVDERDGRVVGVAYYQPKTATDRVWDLTMIAVHPALQGQGRGATLLAQVEQDLRDQDQRLLLIETSASAQYDLTRRFYGKNGYDEEARIRDYWEDGDDLVLFRKALKTQ
ncbi:GNAT family N-acetyltransferase [uncultured Arthrobacter sp.]|uniref:GNAT family N-acetyltransferase n=1 Tax=uncultured Arthrobacter sp. TaxID=114050 RepID=UPI0025F8BD27|nr:GNAT family N-acetyltransferase [uncultured Arthrobacter sp.]